MPSNIGDNLNPKKPLFALAGVGAAFALFPSPASAASSGYYNTPEGGDCTGHYSGGNSFYLRDNAGGNDNDYCYILYGGTNSPGNRIELEEDYNIGNYTHLTVDVSRIST